jgi:hypothetical protein
MTTQKYGFVYIWRDRKKGKFYLGCHWGTETDGYVCSSDMMRKSYRRRPEDFKRRVIERVYTSRTDLLEAEYKWLQLIADDELDGKYYNLNKHHFGHWSTTERAAEIAAKTASKNRGRTHTEETKAKMSASNKGKNSGKVRSAESKAKMSASRKGSTLTDEHKAKISSSLMNQPAEVIAKRASSNTGKTRTEGQRERMSEGMKGIKKSDEHRAKISEQLRARKGQPKSDAWKAKMANRIWVTDGCSNRRVEPSEVPDGWRAGRA